MSNDRREFLQAAGAMAALAAMGGLAACGGDQASKPATAPAPAPEPAPAPAAPPAAAPEPAAAAADANTPPAAGAAPAKVNPTGSVAVALKYVEDATTVDASANPMFKAGSHCANCLQYLGAEGSDWGPCMMFSGQLVKATGWCTAWAPKA